MLRRNCLSDSGSKCRNYGEQQQKFDRKQQSTGTMQVEEKLRGEGCAECRFKKNCRAYGFELLFLTLVFHCGWGGLLSWEKFAGLQPFLAKACCEKASSFWKSPSCQRPANRDGTRDKGHIPPAYDPLPKLQEGTQEQIMTKTGDSLAHPVHSDQV